MEVSYSGKYPIISLDSLFHGTSYLVGGFNPSEKSWSSSDWIIIPAIGEVIKFHGSSHHQPAMI